MNDDIEKYLSKDKSSMDINYLNAIKKLKKDMVASSNEEKANYYWCMEQIYYIQENYIKGYYEIRKHLYERAWLSFDKADILIGSLNRVYDNDKDKDLFHINFISNIIKEYWKLFPYKYFFSRESIIKKEKCSICGQTVRFRGGCKHKIGKLYMGEMCHYIVEDFEITGFAIVKNPFDRYAFLKPVGKEYNYEMLDWLVRYLTSPYEKWHVDTTNRVIGKEYINIKRNEKCPCGSGKKFKKCCLDTDRMYVTHYDIVYDDKLFTETIMPLRYTSTYK